MANGPRLDEFLEEMNAAVLAGQHLMTVGEMPGATLAVARRVTDPARAELDMVFTFEHVNLDQVADGSKWDLAERSLPALKGNLAAWQEGLSGTGWNSLYWNNHDQPRAVSRFGDDSPQHRVASAKTLATVLHLHQGTPYVYQGEELGMTNTLFAEAAHYRDVESVNYHAEAMGLGLEAEVVMRALATKSRDNARTPMQWDDTSQAGFTDGVPWLPVNPNYVSVNAAAAMADPDSVFHHYRRLITLRRESVAVVYGRFALLLADDPQVWAFTRTHAQETLLVVANFSSAPAALDLAALPDLTSAQVLLATHPDHEPERLLPWESRLYRLSASG